jgi:hypothetical protein
MLYPQSVQLFVVKDEENHENHQENPWRPDSPVPHQVDEEKEENQQRLLETMWQALRPTSVVGALLGFKWIQWL